MGTRFEEKSILFSKLFCVWDRKSLLLVGGLNLPFELAPSRSHIWVMPRRGFARPCNGSELDEMEKYLYYASNNYSSSSLPYPSSRRSISYRKSQVPTSDSRMLWLYLLVDNLTYMKIVYQCELWFNSDYSGFVNNYFKTLIYFLKYILKNAL